MIKTTTVDVINIPNTLNKKLEEYIRENNEHELGISTVRK